MYSLFVLSIIAGYSKICNCTAIAKYYIDTHTHTHTHSETLKHYLFSLGSSRFFVSAAAAASASWSVFVSLRLTLFMPYRTAKATKWVKCKYPSKYWGLRGQRVELICPKTQSSMRIVGVQVGGQQRIRKSFNVFSSFFFKKRRQRKISRREMSTRKTKMRRWWWWWRW